jgi:hypothetical protein
MKTQALIAAVAVTISSDALAAELAKGNGRSAASPIF